MGKLLRVFAAFNCYYTILYSFFDYWNCIVRAAVYMQVFLEKNDVTQAYRWESRLRDFGILFRHQNRKRKRKIINLGTHFQQIPYLVCGALCIVLYWVGMFREHIRSYAQPTVTETLSELWSDIIDCFEEEGINSVGMWSVLLDILLGVAAVILFVYIGIKFLNVHEQEIRDIWSRVKYPGKEEQELLKKEK